MQHDDIYSFVARKSSPRSTALAVGPSTTPHRSNETLFYSSQTAVEDIFNNPTLARELFSPMSGADDTDSAPAPQTTFAPQHQGVAGHSHPQHPSVTGLSQPQPLPLPTPPIYSHHAYAYTIPMPVAPQVAGFRPLLPRPTPALPVADPSHAVAAPPAQVHRASAALAPPALAPEAPISKRRALPRCYPMAKSSRFCHVCARSGSVITLVACRNLKYGMCRKAVCEKCFLENGWNLDDTVTNPQDFICCHCQKACPAKAQCRTYARTNERRRKSGAEKRKRIEEALRSGWDADNVLVERQV